MSYPVLDDLLISTDKFMSMHWVSDSRPMKPIWSEPWRFVGSMPNYDKQGCYALFSDDEIIYIGVGAGVGNHTYPGHGLSARIKNYVAVVKRTSKNSNIPPQYRANIQWAQRGMDSIRTIGFDKEYGYFSYALEAYLIGHLPQTKFNTNRPGAVLKNS